MIALMHRTLGITALLVIAGTASAQDFSVAFRAQDRETRQALQQALADAGLYGSTVDGLWGPGTARAVGAAQGSLGFAAFMAEARASGLTDPIAILLDYARTPALTATLPSIRRGHSG